MMDSPAKDPLDEAFELMLKAGWISGVARGDGKYAIAFVDDGDQKLTTFSKLLRELLQHGDIPAIALRKLLVVEDLRGESAHRPELD